MIYMIYTVYIEGTEEIDYALWIMRIIRILLFYYTHFLQMFFIVEHCYGILSICYIDINNRKSNVFDT